MCFVPPVHQFIYVTFILHSTVISSKFSKICFGNSRYHLKIHANSYLKFSIRSEDFYVYYNILQGILIIQIEKAIHNGTTFSSITNFGQQAISLFCASLYLKLFTLYVGSITRLKTDNYLFRFIAFIKF